MLFIWNYDNNLLKLHSNIVFIGVVYRPHLVYNPNTKLYVLIWNYQRLDVIDLYAVAVAATPR